MNIATTYGAPGVSTFAEGMGAPSGGDNMDFLRELVRRRFAMQEQQMAPKKPSNGLGSRAPTGAVATRQPSERSAPVRGARPDYGPTPASLGRFQMNHTGNWGTFVDPANIPAQLQDKIMGGMYGGSTNWDSSNPSITGPQQWRTGKYTHSGGVSMPGQVQQEEESSNSGFDYLSPIDKARAMAAAQRGR